MSYAAAIENLSALIPELFAIPGAPRRKFSLKEIGVLCASLGDPQLSFPSVLVAGTNGKGSTASTLASIARESGLRVGLYTSPHLDRVNERIRLLQPLPGARGLESESPDIPDEDFARLYFRVHAAAEQLVLDATLPTFPSYFELLTSLAFVYFAESRVDLAILEVGMGGRLDATNIVAPILSVITDISLDHQEWLGSTIGLIAREKAGILRPSGTLITLPQHPEANQAIGAVATELQVRGVNTAQYMPPMDASPIDPYPIQIPIPVTIQGTEILVDSPLRGAHQHRNIALAIAAAVELAQNRDLPHNFPITPSAIQRGIHNTHWPGRLERITLPNRPEFILDVAHNPAGAWALRSALSSSQTQEPGTEPATEPGAPHLDSEMWDSSPRQVMIFACLRDKPLREMTQILFPIFDHVVLAPIHSPRATEVAELLAAAEATGVPSTASSTVEEAMQIALRLNPARIVITGSVYLVGEARHLLLAPQNDTAEENRTEENKAQKDPVR
jgi:dihydrofolate synthase / folylpolyglutamate synthase